MTTRRLMREGAADVLPAPVNEPALAISLERLFGADGPDRSGARKSGEVVVFLKAGGGVGATALATQLAATLAPKMTGRLAIADLDVQFGAVALYLDMPQAVSITDFMGPGASLENAAFGETLTRHRSNAQVLAAPRDLTPLEAMSPTQIDGLISGLRQDFALSLIDLPAVWTAWTNRVLSLADRIVLVTSLSVPHVNLVKRQIRVLATQGLESTPLLLVCNGLSPDQQSTLSLKAAERAIGRAFDAVLPEDRKVMNAAINQGVELAAIRRGTKLEKAIGELARKLAVDVPAAPDTRLRW
jgi:pilus assembly protein CpaE